MRGLWKNWPASGVGNRRAVIGGRGLEPGIRDRPQEAVANALGFTDLWFMDPGAMAP